MYGMPFALQMYLIGLAGAGCDVTGSGAVILRSAVMVFCLKESTYFMRYAEAHNPTSLGIDIDINYK